MGRTRQRSLGSNTKSLGHLADGFQREDQGRTERPGVSPASRFFAKSESGIAQCGRMVSEQASKWRAQIDRLLQHGIHVERGTAHLLGRTGQRSRRPTESGQRPGSTGRRRRPALRPGIFPPGLRFRWTPASALSGQRSWPVAHSPTAAA